MGVANCIQAQVREQRVLPVAGQANVGGMQKRIAFSSDPYHPCFCEDGT